MIIAITTLLGKFKYYLIAIFILTTVYFYMTSLKSTIELQEQKLVQNEIDKQNIIEGYEATIIVREQIAKETAIQSEQKEVVVKKADKYKESIKKRGEIKKDEKDCAHVTLVHFD